MVLDPHLIPGFEIVERIASGGVAEVFRAQRESDGLEVALKVMSLGDMDPEFHPVERFEREGAILERINHPTLPRFYGYGVTPGGLGWLALEFVRGRRLSEYALRPVIELIPVFIQVSEGLSAVAQEGIVHRDISPDNILVEEPHGRPRPRLIDFGVAKDLLAMGEAGSLTRHGAFVGKLAYASPEQLLGLPKGETIDFRTDVYSLGVTMYELLAGRRAFPGESLPEIVDAQRKGIVGPLVIPSENGGPAPRLVALVARMTARNRSDRPGSWEEVVAELWRSREEVAPLAETLARKRSSASGSFTAVRQAAPASATATLHLASVEGGARSRALLIGRIVLGAGLVAFAGSVLFAFFFFGSRRPAAVAVPAAVPTAASVPTAAPPPTAVPTIAPPPTARPTRAPGATAAAEARGVLEVALLPAGDLEEILDENGRKVAGKRPLPARFELPPGRYRLRLGARGLDCVKTLSASVNAGKTTSVRESCIEVK